VDSFSAQSLRASVSRAFSLAIADFEPGAAVAAAPGPGELALELLEPTLASGGQARASEQFAGGQRRADRDPTINAHHLPGPRPRDGVWDRGERDVPAADTIQLHPV